MAILASKLEKPASRLADHVLVDIPQGLDALVAKTLARDPQDRFSSAQELLKAWRAVSTGQLTTPAIPFTAAVAEEIAALQPLHDAPTRVVTPLSPRRLRSRARRRRPRRSSRSTRRPP